MEIIIGALLGILLVLLVAVFRGLLVAALGALAGLLVIAVGPATVLGVHTVLFCAICGFILGVISTFLQG